MLKANGWLQLAVCSLSTGACVGEKADGAEWVSCDGCISVGVGAMLCEVDGFSALHGVLTFCLLDTAVPGRESQGAALSVEVEVESLRFLSDDYISYHW